jgi:hypothetical protein
MLYEMYGPVDVFFNQPLIERRCIEVMSCFRKVSRKGLPSDQQHLPFGVHSDDVDRILYASHEMSSRLSDKSLPTLSMSCSATPLEYVTIYP